MDFFFSGVRGLSSVYTQCQTGPIHSSSRNTIPVSSCIRIDALSSRGPDQHSSVFYVGASIKCLVGRLVVSFAHVLSHDCVVTDSTDRPRDVSILRVIVFDVIKHAIRLLCDVVHSSGRVTWFRGVWYSFPGSAQFVRIRTSRNDCCHLSSKVNIRWQASKLSLKRTNSRGRRAPDW